MKTNVNVANTVYNVEKYIHACVAYPLAQTVKNFDIVIVEDPSIRTVKNNIDAFANKRIRYELNKGICGVLACAKSTNF